MTKGKEAPMAEADIPADLFNPGQVFACLGFLEAADILCGDAQGAFDWCDPGNTRFHLRAGGETNPFETVLEFLGKAEVKAISPAGSQVTTEKWNVPTLRLEQGDAFPFPEPRSPATLPVVLSDKRNRFLRIDHWGDRTICDAVKFWAGAGGYPGAAIARDSLDLVRPRLLGTSYDPFSISAPQSSSFRFDWRRDYIPIDAGFSPNEHSHMTMLGFPLVEILAAVGLSNARPQRLDKLNYRYGVLGLSLNGDLNVPLFLRTSLGGTKLPFPQRTFHMRLGWPGQKNQARCIIDVFEEI
jgi:CRISPR-associated protein Csb3